MRISYIIATRNRLPFLRIALQKLLTELQPNEEIVVVDGNSTDGAKEYLQQLLIDGNIHQLVSEPDRNQAHAWNKALLMAKGTIIKKIIDDDVYDYSAIRKCAAHMLNSPAIDLCISNCLTADLVDPQNIRQANRLQQYEAWKDGKTQSFTFSDVHLLIRRSSLSHLGLYDTQFTMLDWEYALRCSFLQANISYYTAYNAMGVNTPGNVTSSTGENILTREAAIAKAKYNYAGDRAEISKYSGLKIAIGRAINYKKRQSSVAEVPLKMNEIDLEKTYAALYKQLADYNLKTGGLFIDK